MSTEQLIVSPGRLLGAFCGLSSGQMHFVQVRWDDMARTAGDAVRAFLDHRVNDLKDYEPIASHGGLVAFRRRPSMSPPPPVHSLAPSPPKPGSELCICNPVSGHHVSLPTPVIRDESFVLLADRDGQFILYVFNLELAGDGVLQIQAYSSAAGRWGGVVGTCPHLPLKFRSRFLRPTPLFLDDVAYFLCESDFKNLGLHVLAVPIKGQKRQLGPIRLPAEVLYTHAKRRFDADELLLASSTVNGTRRLTLAVAEMFTIALWTLHDDGLALGKPARWTRRSSVDLWEIKVEQDKCGRLWKKDGDRVALECFSQSSGAVLFHLHHMLYKLDLQTEKVSPAGLYCKRESTNMCAYDTEEAVLSGMKPKESN
ncbi:unnamed protein product [Alopecurus aequalis]